MSAIQLPSHLSGVPFMGSAEIRDGPVGLLGDVLHVPVSTAIRTHDVFFQGGKAALDTNTRLFSTARSTTLRNSRPPASAFAHGGSR